MTRSLYHHKNHIMPQAQKALHHHQRQAEKHHNHLTYHQKYTPQAFKLQKRQSVRFQILPCLPLPEVTFKLTLIPDMWTRTCPQQPPYLLVQIHTHKKTSPK